MKEAPMPFKCRPSCWQSRSRKKPQTRTIKTMKWTIMNQLNLLWSEKTITWLKSQQRLNTNKTVWLKAGKFRNNLSLFIMTAVMLWVRPGNENHHIYKCFYSISNDFSELTFSPQESHNWLNIIINTNVCLIPAIRWEVSRSENFLNEK